MKKRGLVLALLAVAIAIAVNAFAYTSILNGSNTILNLMKKLNLAYVTPKTYVRLAERLQKKPNYNHNLNQLDGIISDKSGEFIEAAFQKDSNTIDRMLDTSAKYIKSKDGSSFIRYIGNGIHVEGYMATDKKLLKAKQRWHVLEDDNTVTCSMEIYIEDMKSPQLWYLHFKQVKNEWKIYMLENDI
ncbi:MAG: hypothetical protein K0Q65_2077 [Clostridia bacterium]|jgi:hypothetical protein|nr:hypothetical protein [Clostridia bacterium]